MVRSASPKRIESVPYPRHSPRSTEKMSIKEKLRLLRELRMRDFLRVRHIRRFVPEAVAAVSGVLLYASFPPHGNPALAWFALAPLLGALALVPPRRGFRLGLVCGAAWWVPSLTWLWALIGNGGPWILVVLGQVGLALYCALYTAAFGWLLAASPEAARHGWHRVERGLGRGLGRALLAAAVWTGLEWIRSTFLTGFAWNHLGVSQHRSLAVAQLASLGGVYAVSAIVVFVNAGLAAAVLRIVRSTRGIHAPRHHLDLVVALAVAAIAVVWGIREERLWEARERVAPPLNVAGVQPDEPCIFERGEADMLESVNRLLDRTRVAAAIRPDLVVWPETVLPGVLPRDDDVADIALGAARLCGAPVLAGAVEVRPGARRGGRDLVANSSWLFRPSGTIEAPYRKQHLVPFGEYIPLDSWIPVLERLSPVGYSCTAGTNAVLFSVRSRIGGTNTVVSPLICFEDTVAPLAIQAVRQGATLLVDQSNDAWFASSAEAAQHHAQAAFRAIETRTPLVRVSNTGLSGTVSASGRQGAPSAYFLAPVFPRQPDWPLPLYARLGDWALAIPCALVAALAALARLLSRRP